MISDLLNLSTRAFARTDNPRAPPRVDIFGVSAALKAFVAIKVDMMAAVSILDLKTNESSRLLAGSA